MEQTVKKAIGEAPPKQRVPRVAVRRLLRTTPAVVLAVVLAISVVVHVLTGVFFTPYNIGTLFRQVSFIMLVSFGQTLVLIMGGIDLSVASVAGLSSLVAAELMTQTGMSPYLCILVALGVGTLAGVINGALIQLVRLTPFIVTLGTAAIFKGIVFVYTKGMPITGLPQEAADLGQGMLFGLFPYPAIITAVVAVALSVMLRRTPFGRQIFAIGGNEQAAAIVGIRINRVKITVYALGSLLASLGGILMTMRLASSDVRIGENWVMPSITAAILGGTSMSGGAGSIVGTVVGGLMMGVISTSITLTGVSSYWETIVTGGVILVAVVFDALRQKNQRA
jgi:ribose transport system permease protein